MHRILLSLCASVLLGGAFIGCQANPSGRTPIVRRALLETPMPVGDRGLTETVGPEYVQWTGPGTLESNTPIVTNAPIRFNFQSANTPYGTTYKALLAPLPDSPEPASGQVIPPPTRTPAPPPPTQRDGDVPPSNVSYGMFQDMGTNPEFRVFVGSGFVLYAGARPHGETGKGEVTSDGTWMIIKTGATTDRFFLLHADPGKRMTVRALLGAKESRDVTQSLRYVDVNLAGQIGDVKPIPLIPNDPVYQFVDRVIEQGKAAGIPAPPNWPPLS